MCNEGTVVGIDEQYDLRYEAQQDDKRQHNGITHLYETSYDRHHVVGAAGTHGVAHEGAGGGAEGVDRHEK